MADDSRWQGMVDQTLLDHSRRLDSINGSISDLADATGNLNHQLAGIKMSLRVIAVVSTIFLGAAASTLVAAVLR